MFKNWINRFGKKQPAAYVEGGLYSCAGEDGYSVVKILKTDQNGVHICWYSNRFAQRPTDVDHASLYIGRPDEGPMGIGHCPIGYNSFAAWQAQLIKVVAVTEDELQGYGMWQEAQGGYF